MHPQGQIHHDVASNGELPTRWGKALGSRFRALCGGRTGSWDSWSSTGRPGWPSWAGRDLPAAAPALGGPSTFVPPVATSRARPAGKFLSRLCATLRSSAPGWLAPSSSSPRAGGPCRPQPCVPAGNGVPAVPPAPALYSSTGRSSPHAVATADGALYSLPSVPSAVCFSVRRIKTKGSRKASQRRYRKPLLGWGNNHLKVWAWPGFDLLFCFIFFFTFYIPFILITVSPDFSFYFCICHKIKQIIPVFGNDRD